MAPKQDFKLRHTRVSVSDSLKSFRKSTPATSSAGRDVHLIQSLSHTCKGVIGDTNTSKVGLFIVGLNHLGGIQINASKYTSVIEGITSTQRDFYEKKRGERKEGKNKREKKNQVSQCFSGHSTISKAIYFSSRAETSLDLECISVWPLPELQSIPLSSVYLMSSLCCTYLQVA